MGSGLGVMVDVNREVKFLVFVKIKRKKIVCVWGGGSVRGGRVGGDHGGCE